MCSIAAAKLRNILANHRVSHQKDQYYHYVCSDCTVTHLALILWPCTAHTFTYTTRNASTSDNNNHMHEILNNIFSLLSSPIFSTLRCVCVCVLCITNSIFAFAWTLSFICTISHQWHRGIVALYGEKGAAVPTLWNELFNMCARWRRETHSVSKSNYRLDKTKRQKLMRATAAKKFYPCIGLFMQRTRHRHRRRRRHSFSLTFDPMLNRSFIYCMSLTLAHVYINYGLLLLFILYVHVQTQRYICSYMRYVCNMWML